MIGDVLTSSILFEALRESYPDAELHYLIHRHTLPVVENNPFIDRFILFDPAVDGRPFGIFPILKKIRKQQYEIVIDVYAKINTAIITAFSGAKNRISYYKKYTSGAYTHKIEFLKETKTNASLAIANRMLLLQALSTNFPLELKPKIYLTKGEKDSAKTFLKNAGISEEKPLIMMSILGSSAEKTYPLQYMAGILDFIVSTKKDAQILFNYIPTQKKEASQLYELCKKETRKNIFFEIYGKSIREFLAITAQCDAVIGNEGGSINMAKALNKSTFAIFSPWIKREAWNSYENELNVAVHLQDYRPDLFRKSNDYKKDQSILYKNFFPQLIRPKLSKFLEVLRK